MLRMVTALGLHACNHISPDLILPSKNQEKSTPFGLQSLHCMNGCLNGNLHLAQKDITLRDVLPRMIHILLAQS